MLNNCRAAMEHKAGFFFFFDKYNEAESTITYKTETVNNTHVLNEQCLIFDLLKAFL